VLLLLLLLTNESGAGGMMMMMMSVQSEMNVCRRVCHSDMRADR